MKHLKTFESYELLSEQKSAVISRISKALQPAVSRLGKQGLDWLKKKIAPLPAGKIRASQAFTAKGAMKTVINGKRDIGFGNKTDFVDTSQEYWMKKFKEKGIKIMEIAVKDKKDNPYEPFIYYRDTPEAYKKALELKEIAEKYNGILSYKADDKTTRRIGELLGYTDDDIEKHLKDRLPENERF